MYREDRMTDDNAQPNILALTGLVVCNHVGNNQVAKTELPALIQAVHSALAALASGGVAPAAEPDRTAAVSIRKSLASPDHIISMIDGKPYKALKRHLTAQGITPQQYRERYGLPSDYPLVSKAYSEARSTLAKAIGLGRKTGRRVVEAAKAMEGAIEGAVVAKVPAKRGRKPNSLGAALTAAKGHLGG